MITYGGLNIYFFFQKTFNKLQTVLRQREKKNNKNPGWILFSDGFSKRYIRPVFFLFLFYTLKEICVNNVIINANNAPYFVLKIF